MLWGHRVPNRAPRIVFIARLDAGVTPLGAFVREIVFQEPVYVRVRELGAAGEMPDPRECGIT